MRVPPPPGATSCYSSTLIACFHPGAQRLQAAGCWPLAACACGAACLRRPAGSHPTRPPPSTDCSYHDLLWSELHPAAASGSGRGGGAPPPAPGLWGCFATIHPTGLAALPRALLSAGVALRTRLLHRPYGDQGIFVSAAAFRALGGYHELPLLEDVELCSRLRGAAGAPRIVPAAIATSGRRWRALGLLRTTLINQAILLGYALGVDVAVLADWYRAGAPGGAKPAALLAAKA